ncbi:MAG: patatin-like phospholipase family protein [Candidatus Kapabacteria bacterium]|nr:patatin-like phospholipase family protein [Candidatus Kapabacteria bacterium]
MSNLIKILSIDGGGIRGIIPGTVLVALEEKLKKKAGNPNLKIGDCFDFIVGTSTGGILTSALLCPESLGSSTPKFSAKEAVDLYLTRGEAIFDISLWQKARSGKGVLDEKFDNAELKDALNDYFGDTRLSQLIKPCLLTSYDIRNRRTMFFNQMDAKKNLFDDFLLRDISYSTAAAPTYFECSQIKSMTNIPYTLIDGGVFANNPTLCGYAEVRNKFDNHPTAKDMVILSLGTGYSQKPYYYQEAKDWGLVEWVRPILDIMMSGVSETVDYQLRQIYDAVELPEQYTRINAPLVFASSQMDNASLANLQNLQQDGAKMVKDFDKQLNNFVNLCDF